MMRKFLYILFASIVLSACDEAFIPDSGEAQPPLVIEGWIDSGYPPIVFVSSAILAVEGAEKPVDMQESVLRHAKVSVECDGKTYPLTCRYSDSYLTRFYFTTSELCGEAGKTYSLKVEFKGRTATAVTSILPPTPVELFEVEESSTTEGLYSIFATIENNPATVSYHKFFVWDTNVETAYASSYSKTFSNEGAGDRYRISVKRAVRLPDLEGDIEYNMGDVVKVKFATMDEDAFRFWSNYDQNAFCLRLPIISVYRNSRGNVNGALGYWIGYGVSEYEICIR